MSPKTKISEDEHRYYYLDPITKPIFNSPYKNYELRLNRKVNGTMKRPDFSCIIDGIPILNSEVKPLGCTILQRKRDFIKVSLRAKKAINQLINKKGGPNETIFFTNMGICLYQVIFFYIIYCYSLNRSFKNLAETIESFFMDLKYDGLYRSWPSLKTKLVVDKETFPLLVSTFSHFVIMEVNCISPLSLL